MLNQNISPLLGLALVSISGTIAAQQKATEPATVTERPRRLFYDVVSIKPNKSGSDWDTIRMHPNGFTASHTTLLSLIQEAFGVKEHQISGAPSWLNSERYDAEAKMDSSVADELGWSAPH